MLVGREQAISAELKHIRAEVVDIKSLIQKLQTHLDDASTRSGGQDVQRSHHNHRTYDAYDQVRTTCRLDKKIVFLYFTLAR